MHASGRREVQSKVSGAAGLGRRLPAAQAHETSSQDLRDLPQALFGSHQIGRQRIAARKAAIKIVVSTAGLCAHLAAARSRYSVSVPGDGLAPL
jgi:hypothetical protein